MPTVYEQMKALFEPRSVAVIGASANPSKIGYKIVANLIRGGYAGSIFPVNPKADTILDLPVAKSIEDIDAPIDLACVATPAPFVFDAIKQCAAAGVKNAIIITSGFSEIGHIAEERQIAAFAKESGMRILGPNVFGVYSAKNRFNATFSGGEIQPGEVAIVTQSGAIGVALIGKTAAENIGLSSIVSLGNKSDIDEADILEYLIDEESAKIILMYIEGVKDGVRFVNAVKRATAVKPVVVIKSGWSKRGAVAVASHTGSLAGTDKIFDSLMKQAGAVRAQSIQEALHWGSFLKDSPRLKGRNCVIVTNGGGVGVMATDACELHKVNLYDNLPALKSAFGDAVPEFGSVKNPIDLTGQAAAAEYDKALDAALARDDIHSVIALFCETAIFDEKALGNVLLSQFARYRGKKPIAFSLFGGEKLTKTVASLRKKGVPVFNEIHESVSSMGALYFYNRRKNAVVREIKPVPIDEAAVAQAINKAQKARRNFLLADESRMVMEAAGITIPVSRIAANLRQCIEYANEIGYPVVMKVVSRDIVHKSDAGGVMVNLHDDREVAEAFEAIKANCRAYNRNAKIRGMEVARMIEPGVETIIGATRDNTFGPVVMFGLGGIYVEVMKDVAFRGLPLTAGNIDEMISEIRSYPLLLGVRGEKSKDIRSIKEIIVKLTSLISTFEQIRDIEINPLVVHDQNEGSVALDARILISTPEDRDR